MGGKHDKSKHHTKGTKKGTTKGTTKGTKKGHRALAIPPDFDEYPRYGPPAVNVKVTIWDLPGTFLTLLAPSSSTPEPSATASLASASSAWAMDPMCSAPLDGDRSCVLAVLRCPWILSQ